MRKESILSGGDLIDYLVDCTLATVDRLASQKRRSKYEYERQISIAQAGIDKGRWLGVVFSSRAREVIEMGASVESWAKSREVQP